MGFRGIKNRVLVVFWILFFVSMGFMDVLIVSIYLQHSLARITQQKRSALAFICQARFDTLPGGHSERLKLLPDRLPDGDRFFSLTRDQLPQADGGLDGSSGALETLVRQTLKTGETLTTHLGRSFGLFFWQHRSVVITQVVKARGKTIAAAGIDVDLTGVYKAYRRIQKIAFVLIITISLFFALIANRQLTRIYFRPLKRLAVRAESYQDENPLYFAVRKEDSEFSILSGSLNKMLHRIADDKRKLQETIESLRTANRQLKQAQEEVIRAEKLASVGR
jgi:methyl-accepting chemotaxis protein